MDHVIGGKFKLGRKIGSGSFGELYIGLFHVSYSFEIFLFVALFCIVVDKFCLFFVSAVNVQTGEEVAVKLVC
jgi:hypothetical protein